MSSESALPSSRVGKPPDVLPPRQAEGDTELSDMENGRQKSGKGASKKEEKDDGHFWRDHKEEIKSLLPFLWPAGETKLRLCLVGAAICLISAKIFNVLVPITLKAAVDAVGQKQFPAGPVILYGTFRFLTDSTKEARDCLYNHVSAYASRKISLRVFNHVQNLSLRFHLNRKTGAVLRAVSRGSNAFSDLLRYITFQIFPIFFEVGLVTAYLLSKYPWYFGALTAGTIVAYIAFTVLVTEWRNKYRRLQTQSDDAFNQKAIDSLLNFETVKYFCAEQHISDVYDSSLIQVADANIASQTSLSLLNVGQNLIISAGVACAMMLAGKQVVAGRMTVGDFVLVQVFILQLYTPLNFLGTYYRMIKQSLVDVESMFALLKEGREVDDAPGAAELRVPGGSLADIQFRDVVFTYEAKRGPILKGLNISVAAGTRVAVVGSSGAGKSTIARLLFRFYDVDLGAVLICGQDIRQCTQRSVRLAVGIVPQDCVLFNDSLRYNIGFGKLAKGELADEWEVEKAAEAAQLTTFVKQQPQGYATVVGERGLRLSGGEKQRVAIARALLKAPPIMVFDEATSALDSRTEQEIQASLAAAAKGRTNLVIAHRLSTIADADQILVLDGGVVAEGGTHAELIALGGLYCSMWAKQAEAASAIPGPASASTADLASLGGGAAAGSASSLSLAASASARSLAGAGGGGQQGSGGAPRPPPAAVTAPTPPAPAMPSLI